MSRLSPPVLAGVIGVPILLTVSLAVAVLGGVLPWLFGGMVLGALAALLVASKSGFLRRWYAARSGSSDLVPEALIPALDGLSDGVLIIDRKGKIALANQTFLNLSGHDRKDLLGRKALDLGWQWREENGDDRQDGEVPWLPALREGRARQGQFVGLDHTVDRTFVVSVIPILDRKQHSLGAVVSLEDVTKLRKKQAELASLLETLRSSASQLRDQNAALEELVTRDTLTGCINRRAGFELLEKFWSDSRRNHDPLSLVTLDIDRLRLWNEQFGHECTDETLKKVAVHLQRAVGRGDVVCRFGGGEFVILMPRTNLADAVQTCERIRKNVQRIVQENIEVTISVGVSSTDHAGASPQQLLDQADQCLAHAKRMGRNQVVRFDSLPPQKSEGETAGQPDALTSVTIPFPAVTALISALAYRDVETASHSRRVADLCVAVGQGMMSMSGCYVLEMAALLHDIGKIGVPDAILLKPNTLDHDEWDVMKAHDRIGLEILHTSFGSPDLSAIVENYGRRFEDATEDDPLPLGARILAVADAFDSMVTDKLYRPGLSPAEAIAELRRCSGTQFDPQIVETFVEIIYSRGADPSVKIDVAREAALALGMELERLAEAVDEQDLESLRVLAGRLSATATSKGAPEIAAKAMELEQAAIAATDLLGILRCANELLAYCRATQSAFVTRGDHSRRTQLSRSANATDLN